MDNFKCKICQKATKCIFETDVLNRYKAKYFKCLNCGFIQTEKPYWLEEAYKSAITDLDLGLISRNIFFSEIINKIILNTFSHNSKFLDYAGGCGIFTRLMRDKGLNFYREDKYCTNLFAKTFDVKDLKEKQKFELVTAFEVFEHFENPIKDIKKIFKYSDSIIFSTELQPEIEISNEHDWWYFTPETGQHVSFYTLKSLELLARKYGYNFYSNSSNLHLFSKHKFIDNPLINFDSNKSTELPKLETLLQRDFNFIKKLKRILKPN